MCLLKMKGSPNSESDKKKTSQEVFVTAPPAGSVEVITKRRALAGMCGEMKDFGDGLFFYWLLKKKHVFTR